MASRNTPSTSPPARLRRIMRRPVPGMTVPARVAAIARPNERGPCRVTLVRRVTLRRATGGVPRYAGRRVVRGPPARAATASAVVRPPAAAVSGLRPRGRAASGVRACAPAAFGPRRRGCRSVPARARGRLRARRGVRPWGRERRCGRRCRRARHCGRRWRRERRCGRGASGVPLRPPVARPSPPRRAPVGVGVRLRPRARPGCDCGRSVRPARRCVRWSRRGRHCGRRGRRGCGCVRSSRLAAAAGRCPFVAGDVAVVRGDGDGRFAGVGRARGLAFGSSARLSTRRGAVGPDRLVVDVGRRPVRRGRRRAPARGGRPGGVAGPPPRAGSTGRTGRPAFGGPRCAAGVTAAHLGPEHVRPRAVAGRRRPRRAAVQTGRRCRRCQGECGRGRPQASPPTSSPSRGRAGCTVTGRSHG